MGKPTTIKEMARMGGKARAKKLSKQRRIAIARQAINTRWRNNKAKVARKNKQSNEKYSQSSKQTTVPTLGDPKKDGG